MQRRAADAASPAAASNLLKPDPESDPGQAAPRIIKCRPDVAGILREAVEQHAKQQEVGVIAAGKLGSLWQDNGLVVYHIYCQLPGRYCR